MPVQPNCSHAPESLAIALLVAAACTALGLCACGKRDAAPKPVPREVYARGDRVVVERGAAVFFEGRVLGAEGDALRVQAAGDNDPVRVATSDVYRLPPAEHELLTNQLVICSCAQEWQPCILREVLRDGTIDVSSATAGACTVSRERVIAPSSLTTLNLKRYFKRQELEQMFVRGAQHAGEPRPEPSWHPALHERLLVKVSGEWFTGNVRAIDGDGAQVTLSAGQRSVNVPLSALSAEPPSSFVNELRRGDFVLLRPESPSQPWAPREVRSVDGTELTLSDAAGTVKSASVREVVPLRP